jgi:hypothetical protein
MASIPESFNTRPKGLKKITFVHRIEPQAKYRPCLNIHALQEQCKSYVLANRQNYLAINPSAAFSISDLKSLKNNLPFHASLQTSDKTVIAGCRL